MGMFYK